MQAQMKWIGMVLIVASCSGLGIRLGQLYGCRILQCRQIEQCLQRLLGEIRFHQVPLAEALEETGQAMKEAGFSDFLLRVAKRLTMDGKEDCERENGTLGQIWEQELERYLEESLLQEEGSLLLPLGQELGTLDLEAQVRSLRQCLEQWHRHMEGLQTQEKIHSRLCRGLGMSIGVFFAIMLL